MDESRGDARVKKPTGRSRAKPNDHAGGGMVGALENEVGPTPVTLGGLSGVVWAGVVWASLGGSGMVWDGL